MITNQSLLLYFIAGLAAFLTGLSKGGLGGLLGALITALMALVMPLDRALGLALPILMVGDLFAVAAHWRRWNRRLIALLLPSAVVGVTLATFVITNVPPNILRRVIGALVLVFVLYRLFEQRIFGGSHYQARGWHGLVAGVTTGFASTLANAGGPPMSVYLLLQDIKPAMFAATSALFFTVLNWIKVPYYYYAGLFDLRLMASLVWVIPLVPVGVWVGKKAVERAGKQVFERVILGLLAISALMLLFR